MVTVAHLNKSGNQRCRQNNNLFDLQHLEHNTMSRYRNGPTVQEMLLAIPAEADDPVKMREVIEKFKQPKDLTVELMKHQVLGVSWMLDREESAGGGILADDVGLLHCCCVVYDFFPY